MSSPTPYPDRGARRRAVAAWCLYDFGNSAYTTLIVTVVYSVYFREVVVDAPDNAADRLWGIGNFAAMALVAAISPVAGAVADRAGWRKRLLVVSTLTCVVATALLASVGPGEVLAGLVWYVVATLGFELGYVFYNAFLSDVAEPTRRGRVSGWAWAVGYAGGLISLVVCGPLIRSELDGAGRADAIAGRQVSFLVVAAFFLIFALPAFLWLRESRHPQRRLGPRTWVALGLRRVSRTLGHLRDYRETGKFVLASLFFTDGITTIIAFSAIYASTTFHFTSVELVWMFLALNVIAFPGALGAGYLADAIGARRTLVLSLVLWIGVVILGWAARDKATFWIMAGGAAIGMGSTQAVGRSFMSQISPPRRMAEFFGFYVLSGKFASMFGPLAFGLVSSASGSQRLAVLSLLPFFVVGLVLVLTIDERRALAVAAAPDRGPSRAHDPTASPLA